MASKDDKPDGKCEGHYKDGLETWWYENGQKSKERTRLVGGTLS